MQDPRDIFWIRISLEVSVNPFLAGPHGGSFSVRKRMSLLLGDSKELLKLGTYSWVRRARKNDLGRMRARWHLGGTIAVSDDVPLEMLRVHTWKVRMEVACPPHHHLSKKFIQPF